ncbi:MAG: prepilin-type N-terminal cleavage/methylation domain-containing protein [Chromatiaceae bacterium]|nr:prepilin-type N-terminal cleavage/methylation domain-containing protein [Chromatiaceae bacterium]
MSHRSPATPVAEPPVKPAGLRQRGLTLIELLTTLALAAILLTLGVPAFNELMARHRVTALRGAQARVARRALHRRGGGHRAQMLGRRLACRVSHLRRRRRQWRGG